MSVQFYFRDLLSVGVHLSERSVAETDIHPLACRIVPQIVGVIAVLDGLEELKRRSIEHLHRSVLAARDKQPILVCDVERALWFLQPRDRVCAFAGFEIDDFHRVVAQSRNKQPLARDIQRQMIDAPLYAGQRDGLFELERRFCLRASERSPREQNHHHCYRFSHVHLRSVSSHLPSIIFYSHT
jgi:hypothetical protein